MLIEMFKVHAGNVVKTGLILLGSSLLNQALRDQTKETMDCAARDIRRVRYDLKEKSQQTRQEAV